ncbi:MAG: hypothetical protein PHU75_01880 [Candidatus Nanopelagicales bacterium]|nr:hypothetical protein [Candidatus Nanopelagicales bacterium]
MSTATDARTVFGLRLSRRDQPGIDDDVEREEFVPTLPQVDLLPQQVRESMAIARIRRIAALAAVLLLVIAGMLWFVQEPAIQSSEQSLATAQAINAKEQLQVQALSPIAQMVAQIKGQEQLVTSTLTTQPRASTLYGHLLLAARSTGAPTMRFSTLSATYLGAPAAGGSVTACPNPDPFAEQVAIGCITFSATAGARDQVSRLLVALSRDPLFVGPYVNSSMLAAQGAGGAPASVSFTGTVGITPAGLATKLTDQQVRTLLAPATPTPAPTTAPGGSS